MEREARQVGGRLLNWLVERFRWRTLCKPGGSSQYSCVLVQTLQEKQLIIETNYN